MFDEIIKRLKENEIKINNLPEEEKKDAIDCFYHELYRIIYSLEEDFLENNQP